MRAVQLGGAIGADLIPNCTEVKTFRSYDIVVVVKRINEDSLRALRTAGVFVVWDVVDAWPQFAQGNSWNRVQCLDWFARECARIRPHAIVAATHAMQRDIQGYLGAPPDNRIITLPHHGRQVLGFEVRDRIRIVGYEGAEHYVGRWGLAVHAWCADNGAKFVINGIYSAYDVVLAVRDDPGYAASHWKSNVKLANAQMTGIPVVCSEEMGYRETASGAERWVRHDDRLSVRAALDSLKDRTERELASDKLRMSSPRISISQIADDYRSWLWSLK